MARGMVGMGEVLSVIEDVEKGIEEEGGGKMGKKVEKGKGLEVNEFKEEMEEMRNMGGVESVT